MFQSLTNLIAKLEADSYGEWIFDNKSKGTEDDPIQMPYVKYTEVIHSLIHEIYEFSDTHPEYELTNYKDILVKHGLEWGYESMKNADINSADGQTVMALLMASLRADRFCEGTLLSFCEDGTILKWLKRLNVIDSRGM